MANRAQIEEALRQLSVSQGGSLVKEPKKNKMRPEPCVFIGLGGIGCKTVDRLKALVEREYEQNPNCAFLAVDTSQPDLAGLKEMNLSEKFELFDPAAIKLPSRPPAHVQSWLCPDFPKDDLKNTGAEGVRQAARLMLCGTKKYRELRAGIEGIIQRVRKDVPDRADRVQINLFAGLCGGTGSGTVVDIAYMIHNIMEQTTLSYDLRGFFYLPDVQEFLPGVSQETRQNLELNAYAALKEIDYFIQNGAGGNSPSGVVYSLNTGDDLVKSSRKIFNVGDCILVSSRSKGETAKDVNAMIERVSRFAAYIYTDISEAQTTAKADFQDILSYLCDFGRGKLPEWIQKHTLDLGKEDEDAAEKDNAPAITDNPRWAGYFYSAIGQAQVAIPRDEIFAYCANLVFRKMYDKYKDSTTLTQAEIDTQTNGKSYGAFEKLFGRVQKSMVSSLRDFRIDEKYYPDIVPGALFGTGRRTENTHKTTGRAEELASQFNDWLNSPGVLDAAADGVASEILADIQELARENGPFYAMAYMAGLGGGENHALNGYLDKIDAFREEIPRKRDALEKAMQAKKDEMNKAEVERMRDKTPTDRENRYFAEICEDCARACADVHLIQKFDKILDGIYGRIRRENYEEYETCTTAMEVLGDMLQRDSAYAVGDSRARGAAKSEALSFDAIDFGQDREMRKKFLDLFADCFDAAGADRLAKEFQDNMFGERTRRLWRDAQGDRAAFAQNIRAIFQEFFAGYTKDALEKFVVAAYCGESGLTPARLSEIWDATPDENKEDFEVCEEAVRSAAREICDRLRSGSSVMLESSIGPAHIDTFPFSAIICLPASTPRLNAAIQEMCKGRDAFAWTGDAFKAQFTRFEMRLGIPAATILGMNEYALGYYQSGRRGSAAGIGRHLDEGAGQWDKHLPEIYGVDADAFYTKKSVLPPLALDSDDFQDLHLMIEIRDKFRDGVKAGWIVEGADCYTIYRVRKVRDAYASFREKLAKKSEKSSLQDIWDLAYADSGIVLDAIDIKPADKTLSALDPLQKAQDDYEFTDVHRIIRRNMTILSALLDAYDEYGAPGNILDVTREVEEEVRQKRAEAAAEKAFVGNVQAFASMFCYGLLQYDKKRRTYLYRASTTSPWQELFTFDRGMIRIDKDARVYLAFVCGYLPKSEMFAGILEAYSNPVLENTAIYQKAAAFLASPRMHESEQDARDRKLNDEVARSAYQDSYSYPHKDSVHRNLYEFYTVFTEYLKSILPAPTV